MTEEDPDDRFYRDTESIAFPKLTDHQLALLEPLGERRLLRKGDEVFKAGQRDLAMTVVFSGEVEVFEFRDGHELILATHGPRDFVGDVGMLNGTSAISSARGKAEVSEILVIQAAQLRRALAEQPDVGEPLTQAFIMRRERLRRDKDFAGLRIVSKANCRDAQRIHDFLDKNRIPHRLIESQTDAGRTLCDFLKVGIEDLPILIANDGSQTRKPTIRQVAEVAGLLRDLAVDGATEILCDLAVVGAGPAGLAAAVYAASEGLKTVVLESYAPGGQAASSSLIENFFGFPTGISGGDLTNRAQLQAYRFGAVFSTPSQAMSLTFSDQEHCAELRIEGCPATLRAKSVIIATGADYRRIEAEDRERYEGGLGVYYAATAMEANLCRGATVIVVGGGNSAGQAAMYLSEFAAKVLLVIRGEDLHKSMSSYLTRRIETHDKIEVLRHTVISKMLGANRLESVELLDCLTNESRTVKTPSVFSMIGAKPCTHWLPPEIECDESGFIKTGTSVANSPAWLAANRPPGTLETSRPNIFAAGDVRSGSVKRCGAAVGEGGMAIEGVHKALGTYS